MEIKEVRLTPPPGCQIIIGQSHFIKTVEDIYEVLASSMPGVKFGISFCESSGKTLIRYDGTDEEAIRLALDYATSISAGHSFVIVLRESYPINVLNRVKSVEEVANIYCATANAVTVLVAEVENGRGILGVVDGLSPTGVESASDKDERKEFLRKIGYKR